MQKNKQTIIQILNFNFKLQIGLQSVHQSLRTIVHFAEDFKVILHDNFTDQAFIVAKLKHKTPSLFKLHRIIPNWIINSGCLTFTIRRCLQLTLLLLTWIDQNQLPFYQTNLSSRDSYSNTYHEIHFSKSLSLNAAAWCGKTLTHDKRTVSQVSH